MQRIRITDFVLFQKEGSYHYTGYANYFGLEKRQCIIKRMKNKYIVLVQDDNGEWMQIGIFYPQKPEPIRGAKEYELIGIIWTPDFTYYVVRDGNRFLGL